VIRERKAALRWTRLSCHAFRPNAVALAYNLANILRSMALRDAVAHWSLITLHERLVNIGARIVRHSRYAVFKLAEVAVPRTLFATILAGPSACAARRWRRLITSGHGAAGAEGGTYAGGRAAARERPRSADGLGSGSPHLESSARYAFRLTGDRRRSRISGARYAHSGNVG
jgi:hypothetical protein